ncbi:sensor histidine kinase [Glaciihabitans arcticus]|uniref:histidine kinase n=1 Tax=Glaciihabitans arcticus TaxID=2668039 RepID=A0A4Q9GTQ7_9MICO|nr:sensor histidine kinase [Glaciihabitans arcticus]TBN58075.1 sensor histidine kinase [Glaciihabitans arcticus]
MTIEWTRPRPTPTAYRRDVIGAALLGVGAAVSALLYQRLGMYEDPAPIWLTVVALATLTLPLAARRRFPVTVAFVVTAGFFVGQQFAVPEFLITNIALFVAIYSIGAWTSNRRVAFFVRTGIIVGMFIWVFVSLVVTASDPDLLPGFSRSGVFSQLASWSIINVLTNVLYFGGAYYFGNSAFAAARSRAELEARTLELAAEREHSADQAVTLDRVRIARELHDVVAHHVSLMGVQAGAARRVLSTDPEQAAASLATIEQSARSAVDELHRMLATLRDPGEIRDDDAASTSSSTRGVDQLPELVAETSAAGVPATLTIVGEVAPVSSVVGFTLYRIAQEALTNTRKHGGASTSVDVRLRYLDDAVEVEVSDTGVGRKLIPTGIGHGQRGMLERVAAVGGTLQFGPRPRGGYLVRANIPLAGTVTT